MGSLDEEIQALKNKINGYEASLEASTTEKESDKYFQLIIRRTETLNFLLDEKKRRESATTETAFAGSNQDAALLTSLRNLLEQGLKGGRRRHDTDKTPAGYAAGVKASLSNLYVTISSGEGPSFLTEAESDAARSCSSSGEHERHLVAFMTPIFQERLLPSLPSGYVLVNSEEYSWIPQSADLRINYVAPDQFVAPRYLVQFRTPYKNAPSCNGDYGTFPVFNARRSLITICDAKKRLNNEGEGEFMKYLEALSFSESKGENVTMRGFVYDWETCSLMTAANGVITQMTTIRWTTPGSLAVVRDYFTQCETDWHQALQRACTELGVTLPRYSSAPENCGQCVLGAGAFGRVFEVFRGEQRLALKLVLNESSCDELVNEFEVSQNLPAAARNCVISIVNDSLWRSSLIKMGHSPILVAAFLMDTVGIPFAHRDEVSDEYGPLILEALSDLHAADVCHGDARYNNVVRLEYDGPPKRVDFRWIDLRSRSVTTSINCTNDIICFFKSIDRLFDKKAVIDFATRTVHRGWPTIEQRHLAARELWSYNQQILRLI